jgi:F-type H+-transporting ATPase subunit epsilon
MTAPFLLTIASPSTTVFRGEAVSIIVPGSEGVLEVLAHHEPFVTTLASGNGTYTDATGTKHTFIINSGILEVTQDGCTVLL